MTPKRFNGTDWVNVVPNGIPYTTTAPSSANNDGTLKIVVLSSEPATKYSGYLYIITEE